LILLLKQWCKNINSNHSSIQVRKANTLIILLLEVYFCKVSLRVATGVRA